MHFELLMKKVYNRGPGCRNRQKFNITLLHGEEFILFSAYYFFISCDVYPVLPSDFLFINPTFVVCAHTNCLNLCPLGNFSYFFVVS